MNFPPHFQYRSETQRAGSDYNNHSKIGDGVQTVFSLFVYSPKACHPYSFGFLGLCEFYQSSAVQDKTLKLHDKQKHWWEDTNELKSTQPTNWTYIPVSRVASVKLGSGWFTRTTREREIMLDLKDTFPPLQFSFISPWDNHSYSHATSVMFTTATTSTEAFKLEISVKSKCSSQETVISQLKF